jgi:hypothetical protein
LFAVSIFLVLNLRKNGILTVAFVVVALLIFSKLTRKHVLIGFAIGGGISLLLSLLYIPLLNPVPDHRGEKFSIPLQQVAAVMSSDGASISDDNREYFDLLLPDDQWRQLYKPSISDPIKDNIASNIADDQWTDVDFLKHWVSLGVSNFGTYLTAYADQTGALWSPFYTSDSTAVAKQVTAGTLLKSFALWITSNCWIYFYLSVALLILALKRRDKTTAILLVIPLSIWLSLILTAPVVLIRYVMPMVFPLVFVVATNPTRRHADKTCPQ